MKGVMFNDLKAWRKDTVENTIRNNSIEMDAKRYGSALYC
jgi:hypothetical protein